MVSSSPTSTVVAGGNEGGNNNNDDENVHSPACLCCGCGKGRCKCCPFKTATYGNHKFLVTSQIMAIIAFMGLAISCFFISFFTYSLVAGLLLLFVLGLPTFIMSQLLWCYKMRNCTLIVYGIFSLLTGIGCVGLGLYLILYPECRYSYDGSCDDDDEYYDDGYGYSHNHRFLEHTTSPWKPFGIMALVDSVLWFTTSFTLFYFCCNNRNNLTDTTMASSNNDEEAQQNDELCVCSPYGSNYIKLAQVLSIPAIVLFFFATWFFLLPLSLIPVILLQVTWCCKMTKCGLITAAVFSLLVVILLIFYVVTGLIWYWPSAIMIVDLLLWLAVTVFIILFIREGGVESANARSITNSDGNGNDEGDNSLEGKPIVTASASVLDETTKNDSTAHVSDTDNKESNDI